MHAAHWLPPRSVGTIDEDAINNLAFVADLTKHIQTKTTTTDAAKIARGTGAGSGGPRPTGAFVQVHVEPGCLWSLLTPCGVGQGEVGACTGMPTECVCVCIGAAAEDGTAYVTFFPSFLWVLRDFNLTLVDEVRGWGTAPAAMCPTPYPNLRRPPTHHPPAPSPSFPRSPLHTRCARDGELL